VKDTFIVQNMAEADDGRITNQQLEYPYGIRLPPFAQMYSVDSPLVFCNIILCQHVNAVREYGCTIVRKPR